MEKPPIGFNSITKALRLLLDFYFRADVLGEENIPNGPCLFVGNHNAIIIGPEIWIFGTHYFKHHNNLRTLGHDLVLKIPVLSQLARSYLKYIENNFQSARTSLNSGQQVLVYPGGGWESCRPSKLRDKIDFNNRSGFIRLAREAKVPIVPIVATGAHDGLFIWKRGTRIAKGLGLKKLFRIDAFPLGLSFPFLLQIGPLFPFIPLPRKVVLEILPPLDINNLNGESDLEKSIALQMLMQETMNCHLPKIRRSSKIDNDDPKFKEISS